MDLTDSRGRTYVSAQLLGRIYPSWPWQNDATVVHDYAILMMMNICYPSKWYSQGYFLRGVTLLVCLLSVCPKIKLFGGNSATSGLMYFK